MKTIIKSQLKRLISGFSYGFYIVLGMFFTGSIIIWAASLTATSGSPLTASNWNNMVSNLFWGSGSGGIYYNGNVGIGTNSPLVRLDVSSSSNTDFSLTAGAGLRAGITLKDNDRSWTIKKTGGADNFYINDDTIGGTVLGLEPQLNTTPKLWINSAGNVGIGTTTPTEKLEVSGTIKASSLSTNTGGFFRMHLHSCSGPCAGNDTLNTWTSKGGLTWDTAYNTNSALFTKDSKGVVTVNQAGTYLVSLFHMAAPVANSQRGGAGQYCPFINGSANCHYGGSSTISYRYNPAGAWDNGKHDFVIQMAAGSTVARGYRPFQAMTYWGHDGYVSLEITRIN